ncbi:Na(+)/H(+) antiporter subunit C [Ruania suaedae]|uniref:Na(+)/H(+) antiporter subunit C n=1 Tax=Ruania suaedae TaxID=2897774 RepID=UPI001E31ABE5|nr:Na(+)/H(+) antiporter subunit C [Ruania suaedae]UFU04699.1 Na(+)/H(+) antiporter subunit C [Ruania suaedae]
MTPSLALVVVVGVLVGTGVYLVLERSLSRVVIGVTLISNGVNVLFLIAGGAAGGPPLIGTTEPERMSDPLTQFMVLTAIVINLALTAFVLAMAYRSWQLHGHDEVQDDLEDRRVAQRAARAELDSRADDVGTDLATEAAEARDETEEQRDTSGSGGLGGPGRSDDGGPAGTDRGERP